ncbi:MAG: glycosyltransferase [Parasporobacterium sp.]|nr:glycosyltransferase [Parasporobacterium sp.]
MNNPKLTIVLPALNSENYIRQCVDSILAQTFRDFELLCIDAGSTDGTLEIFHEYASSDDRVSVINSDMRSYGHQVNLGLDAARGTYFCIVESDDFIDSHMYENLMKLTQNDTADVVKGNYYDYFDYEGMTPIAAPNGERHKMLPNGSVFRVNDCPHILEGHPSIWSALYRTGFLRALNIRFMELPGGGWTDNPFFFETLCSADKICWTDRPYYYYRRTNPNSSSNKIPDLTLPVRRMMDNLDVVERFPHLNEECLQMVYERAVYYLNGSLLDPAYPTQETEIREMACTLYNRINRSIIDNSKANGWYRTMYYRYLSPLLLKRPRGGRILIYYYLPHDVNNRYLTLSESHLSQIKRIRNERYDIDIFVLAVREGLDPDRPYARIEHIENRYSQTLFTYEVVNSQKLTEDLLTGFINMFGPFVSEYYVTDKGLSEGVKQLLLSEEGHNTAGSYEDIIRSLKDVPRGEDITLTSEEYQRLMCENDYHFRILENNQYGEIFDTTGYHLLKKIYFLNRKTRGGIRCCKDHGIPYTIRLFIKRQFIKRVK